MFDSEYVLSERLSAVYPGNLRAWTCECNVSVAVLWCSSWFNATDSYKLVCKGRVILLQGKGRVRLHRREGDGRVGLASLGESGVVHAGDADAKRDGVGVLLRAQRHLVEDDGLEIPLSKPNDQVSMAQNVGI